MKYLFLFIMVSHVLGTKGDSKVEFTEDYSLHERPPTKEGEPVLIEASINLRNILDVAEKEQIISLETTLRLYWKVGGVGEGKPIFTIWGGGSLIFYGGESLIIIWNSSVSYG